MISVSSSEARSEIGLELGLAAGMEEEEMMEDNDFEEEESTHSYVSCVDPDVALSYIDEKLENVLGHFQKDFEGGVSAENLGAKFGGYGSFLSMYQRSPACKSPPEVQNQVGVRSTCSASSAVPQVSVCGSTSKAPASDVLVKLKNFVKASTPDSKQKHVSNTSSSSAPSNHKTLRLRIKVGSNDLSSLKNASNCTSKQGLNMPPSTSRVNSAEEGLLNGIHDSPTKILMAMVSFPLHTDQLLSPLSDDLILLAKKDNTRKDASVNKSDSKSKHHILGVSDAQKCAAKFSTAKPKKEKLKERVKYMPPSNGNHFEKEGDNESCEELVSKTLKLPLLSCLSPAKEIDKVSDSHVDDVEGRLRGKNNGGLDAALMDSKPELEGKLVAFPDRRKDVYLTEGETSRSKRERVPSVEHVHYSSVDKVSESEARKEEQSFKPKLPKAHKSVRSSSRNSLRGKDAAVNMSNMNVSDTGGSEDMYKVFSGDSGESKEEKQSSLALKAKKENLSEVNGFKESLSSVRNDEKACNYVHSLCEPDSKHLTDEDRHNTQQNIRLEVNNKHSDEGIEDLGMEPERELSGTCKKPKTGRSRFSAGDQPGSNKILDLVNKTTITQASAQKEKDVAKTSSHDGRDERKRKQKENKESGDCMRPREAAVMESGGEKVRNKKRFKGSSCDGKELPYRSTSCDRDRGVSQENGRDNASHLPFSASSPSLCKDLGSETIKTSFHEAKDSLVESRELKSGRILAKDEHRDTDSNAGDTLKRCRDGEGYSTNKAAEVSKDNNLRITGEATHSWDKERAYGEKCSTEIHKPKRSGRYSGDNGTEGESQRKNREENNRVTEKEVKTKESRSKRRPARKDPMESSKEDSREYQDPSTKVERNGSHFPAPQKSDREKTSHGKSNHLEVTAEKLKSRSAPDQVEVLSHGTEISDTKRQMMRNDNHSVTHNAGSRNQKQNGSRHKNHVGSSPLRKESTMQAFSNSLKEATALKHIADRLKNNDESHHEGTGFYFQAALKFLHGASILESSGTEYTTHKSNAGSIDIYGSTAKLCGYCAREYEKYKDMGAAALAYKCMEVAFLRITYSSHGSISRCRNELQAALQVVPSGESPSFASDGENSNQTLAAEKVALSNTVRSSPSVTGSLVISSGNNSSLSQLLEFSQNVSSGMDASRKAQIAFAAAKGGKSGETRYSSDGIASIKKALDFNFQDMDKLLHVVRLAMESINR
ncbi:unnamed protein product [Microthlaspi erraticum]|uniref:CWZF3/5/7 THD domain-containing protein n=1 Tax=Microthlaspi erraticum TaxID=1685480 RepID=A0A6D2L8J6_9BRAS|nr:unnamed protein product [Microthlaspi erraticum]